MSEDTMTGAGQRCQFPLGSSPDCQERAAYQIGPEVHAGAQICESHGWPYVTWRLETLPDVPLVVERIMPAAAGTGMGDGGG